MTTTLTLVDDVKVVVISEYQLQITGSRLKISKNGNQLMIKSEDQLISNSNGNNIINSTVLGNVTMVNGRVISNSGGIVNNGVNFGNVYNNSQVNISNGGAIHTSFSPGSLSSFNTVETETKTIDVDVKEFTDFMLTGNSVLTWENMMEFEKRDKRYTFTLSGNSRVELPFVRQDPEQGSIIINCSGNSTFNGNMSKFCGVYINASGNSYITDLCVTEMYRINTSGNSSVRIKAIGNARSFGTSNRSGNSMVHVQV